MADEDVCGEGIVFPGWLPEIWHVHAKLNWHFEIVGDDTFCQVLSEVRVEAFHGLCPRLDPKKARENIWEPNFDKFSYLFLFWFGRLREAEYRAACHGRSLLLLLPVAWGECTRNVTVWPDSGHTVTLRVRGGSGPDSWTYDSPLCNDGKKPNE